MNMRMELTFDFQTVVMFMLIIMVNYMPRAAGVILNTTAPTCCKDSSANINFTVDVQGGTIGSGSEIWYHGTTVIATRPSGVLIPKANYTGRLYSYSAYGLTLDNVTRDDEGGYYYEFYFFSPAPEGTKTATASLSVIVAPGDSCIPRYTKSGIEAVCELDQTANCGSPQLEPKWTHASGNSFTIDKSGTYTCCANGSALTNCYKGSSSFCKDFNVTVTASLPTLADCALEYVLGYGLGVGLCVDTICIICLILIVILVKIVVTIQAKDEVQKPRPKGSEVTITASVCGFWISSVHWTGPQGNTLTSGKYYIQYNKKAGISTLKITNLEINDSGLYTCHAIDACGSSAQDSVRISVYEKLAVDIDIGETFGQHGSDVEIICSVYGSENKSVDWTGPEEKILINGGRCIIASYDSNTNKSSLVIRTSSMTVAEGYICQVAFKESGVSVKIYITITVLDNVLLRVIEKIILSVPASENVSKEWIGLPGKTLTNPASENERREGTGPEDNILTSTGKYTKIPYDRNTNKSHLTVKKFSVNDHGSYTCQAMDSSESHQKTSITITTNDATNPNQGASKLILGLCFGIICVVCIVGIVILVPIGSSCDLKLGLGLGLVLGIPIIGCIIVIVILVKKDVTIQAKDELQKPIPEGLEITITAFVDGFYISSVQWNGPDGNILTSNGKYNIKYNKGTGISILQISALEINDSGLYTCCATGVCGSSAQDSVRISVNVLKPTPTPAPENRKIKSGKAVPV